MKMLNEGDSYSIQLRKCRENGKEILVISFRICLWADERNGLNGDRSMLNEWVTESLVHQLVRFPHLVTKSGRRGHAV